MCICPGRVQHLRGHHHLRKEVKMKISFLDYIFILYRTKPRTNVNIRDAWGLTFALGGARAIFYTFFI